MALRRLSVSAWLTTASSKMLLSTGTSEQYTSGIEHADALSQIGKKHKLAASTYKCGEYHGYGKWSFYDLEMSLTKYRLPQPNPKVPDTPRDTKPSPLKTE